MLTAARLFRGTALALLVLALASVTASAAGRGNGNGNGNGWAGTGNSGNGNGSGNGKDIAPPAPVPVQTPPGQAKTPATPATTAPGQLKKNTTASGTAADPGTPGAGTPAENAPVTSPTAIPVAPAAPPVLGRSVNVSPVAGTVVVRVPGSDGYAPLSDVGSIPTGSVVDARRGTLVLRTALDGGDTQAAKLRGAVFEVRQSRTGEGVTDLVLRADPPATCGASAGARAAAVTTKARKRAKPGALWASDRKGRFRTRGRNSVATVRGTRWSTRETCAGTVTRVMQGAVDVRDAHTGRTVTVRAGHAYLARRAG